MPPVCGWLPPVVPANPKKVLTSQAALLMLYSVMEWPLREDRYVHEACAYQQYPLL